MVVAPAVVVDASTCLAVVVAVELFAPTVSYVDTVVAPENVVAGEVADVTSSLAENRRGVFSSTPAVAGTEAAGIEVFVAILGSN